MTTISPPRPRIWDILITWFSLGIQSFGGGTSTFYLIHEACIGRGWIEESEFVRAWALVQVSPGINLIKLTALIGYQLRGWGGLTAAMAGLLLPSAAVTVLMTAGFAALRGQPLVQSAMKGVLPATIGLSLAMAWQMAQPLLGRALREGRTRLGANLAVMAAAALLLAVAGASPVVVLLLAGGITVPLMAVLPGHLPQRRQHAASGPAPANGVPGDAQGGARPGPAAGPPAETGKA
jgi:chromate transporter